MRSIILSLVAIVSCISCKKEKMNGIPTVIRGHVRDSIRGIDISGYKIVLVKNAGTVYSGWVATTIWEDIATVYTDNNGEYSITFDYHIEPGQNYYLEEQYYGTPYYHESS